MSFASDKPAPHRAGPEHAGREEPFIDSAFYPPALRGTGLGIALGIGRLGAIFGPAYLSIVTIVADAPRAPFFAFMATAVLAAIVIALLPTKLTSSTELVAAPAAA